MFFMVYDILSKVLSQRRKISALAPSLASNNIFLGIFTIITFFLRYSSLASETWRRIHVGASRHNIGPNSCGLSFASVYIFHSITNFCGIPLYRTDAIFLRIKGWGCRWTASFLISVLSSVNYPVQSL